MCDKSSRFYISKMDHIISKLREAGPEIPLQELGPLYSRASVQCGKLLQSGLVDVAINKLTEVLKMVTEAKSVQGNHPLVFAFIQADLLSNVGALHFNKMQACLAEVSAPHFTQQQFKLVEKTGGSALSFYKKASDVYRRHVADKLPSIFCAAQHLPPGSTFAPLLIRQLRKAFQVCASTFVFRGEARAFADEVIRLQQADGSFRAEADSVDLLLLSDEKTFAQHGGTKESYIESLNVSPTAAVQETPSTLHAPSQSMVPTIALERLVSEPVDLPWFGDVMSGEAVAGLGMARSVTIEGARAGWVIFVPLPKSRPVRLMRAGAIEHALKSVPCALRFVQFAQMVDIAMKGGTSTVERLAQEFTDPAVRQFFGLFAVGMREYARRFIANPEPPEKWGSAGAENVITYVCVEPARGGFGGPGRLEPGECWKTCPLPIGDPATNPGLVTPIYRIKPSELEGGDRKCCEARADIDGAGGCPSCGSQTKPSGCAVRGGSCSSKRKDLIWCSKCQVVGWCSVACKRRMKQEHKWVCKMARECHQTLGLGRVCYRCGVPGETEGIELLRCSRCKTVSALC